MFKSVIKFFKILKTLKKTIICEEGKSEKKMRISLHFCHFCALNRKSQEKIAAENEEKKTWTKKVEAKALLVFAGHLEARC